MRDRCLAAAAVVALTLTGGACGGSSGPSRAARTAYLQALHDADPQINHVRSDESLVRLGQAACADFSSGAPFTSVAEQLQSGTGLSPSDIGTLLTSALTDFCPKYRAQAGAP